MARAIDVDKAIEIIEKKQKELCPVGRYGRNYVYGSDREKWDAWDEIIAAIDALPTLTPPNEPLTLEELSKRRDPVWIKRLWGCSDVCDDGWAIVDGPVCLTRHNDIPVSWEIDVLWPGSEVPDAPKYENYGKTWIAYRRQPEERG